MNKDFGILKISDGTVEINLLDLCLLDWRPKVLGLKGSATELDSPYSQGRQLVQAEYDDITDLFQFNPKEESSDDLIESGQDVRRLLEMARNYWLTEWQDTPVYLIARGQCETNTRYAQITKFLTPEDGNPYASPFNNESIFEDWNLSITHRPWQEIEPGETVCAEAFAGQNYCIWNLLTSGANSNISIAPNALINDLPTADFTVEVWVNPKVFEYGNGYSVANEEPIAAKQNWQFTLTAVGIDSWRIEANIVYGVQAVSQSSTLIYDGDGWVHIAMVSDFSNKTILLFLNGTEVKYSTQTVGNGAYVTDVAQTLYFASINGGATLFDGNFGWLRISDSQRYSSDFSPPERCFLPIIDADTVGVWVYEGNGAVADNAEGTAAIDGTIANMGWVQGCVDGSDSYFGGGFDRCNYSLNFNVANSFIRVPDDVSIQDLPTADFTIDWWVFRENTGIISPSGTIVSKNVGLGHITEIIDDGSGRSTIRFRANFAVTDIDYLSSTKLRNNDWNHIAVVFDSATKTVEIYLNGIEVEYTTQQVGVGAYVTDVGNDMWIGGRGAATYLVGKIAWLRITGSKLYTSSFTPPDLCSFPGSGFGSIALWIYEGQGVIAHNAPLASGGTAIDGAISLSSWESLGDVTEVCCNGFGTCEKENYFSLSSALNQITHVFYYDASGPTYSSNIQSDNYFPRELLPVVPAVNDILYIGTDNSVTNTGVFNNVIFDILTGTVVTAVFEYWNGAAWAAIPNLRNTTDDNPLSAVLTLGNFANVTDTVCGLFYEIPSAWATTTVNGVLGYFTRVRVTALPGGATQAPIQQNQRLYTVNWPWVDLDEQAVPGDIEALAYSIIYGEGRDEAETEGIPSFQRLVMALRSNERGTAFNPYLNISDEQTPCGLTVTKRATGTWTTDIINAPTGRYLVDVATGTGWQDIVDFDFDDTLALAYYGSFRAYLLAKTAIATIQYRLKITIGPDSIYTDPVTVIDTAVIESVELEEIELPFSDDISNTDVLESMTITVQANITAIGNQTEYYYAVLMPSDEFIVDAGNFNATEAVREDHPLDIDSIKYPKRIIRTWQKSDTDYEYSFKKDAVGAFFLQNNADQRLFFFGGVPGTDNWIQTLAVNAIQLFRNARYHSMRGSR